MKLIDNMELIKTFGMIAGIGGLALGVLLIIFREIIRKKIFPQLTKQQSYKLIRLMVIFVFIVAVVGIIAWVYAKKLTLSKDNHIEENVSECADLRVNVFEKIPWYLVNTIQKRKMDFLYYTHLTGVNKCKQKVTIKVKFYVINPDFAIIKESKNDKGGWLITTVHPGETIRKDLRPTFEYLRKPETDEIIRVQYIIQTIDEKSDWSDYKDIKISAKDLVYWDLKTPKGENVPQNFLLASLSAWWDVKDPVLENLARRYLDRGSASSAQDWFKKCYINFFDQRQGSFFIKVNPYPESWPLAGAKEASKQRICKPTEVAEGKIREIHSLEAVLFLAALTNNLPERCVPKLVLWAVPDPREGNRGVKRFLLSWTPDGKDWRAIDVTDPNKMSFADSESQATATVGDLLLKSGGEIMRSLKKDGVFIEGGKFVQGGRQILALDFYQAYELHNIRVLP